jgi:hypothetical protein
MSSNNIEPKLGAESFSCPHCNAVAHQDWYRLFLQPENAAKAVVLTPETAITLVDGEGEDRNEIDQFVERLKKHELTFEYQNHPQTVKVKMANLHLSNCHNCNGFAVWVRGRLMFPGRGEEMPDLDLVEADFEEAAAMLNKFPRGATALIHVCIEKLMPLLRKAGKDEDISSLLRKGLEVEIHQTMEALQVLRKSPVQLTQFNSQEDRETALRFFDSLKEILERRMLKNPNEN